jgi:hypothetical protein
MTLYYSALSLIILLTIPFLTNGQSDQDTVTVLTNCKSLPYRKNVTKDDTKLQVDSIAPLIKGRWYSEAIESVVKPSKIVRSIELQLNRRWRGVLFEDGKRVATFQLQVERGHSDFIYKISHVSRALYSFPTIGYLLVCPPHLILSSEDDIFLFERSK